MCPFYSIQLVIDAKPSVSPKQLCLYFIHPNAMIREEPLLADNDIDLT